MLFLQYVESIVNTWISKSNSCFVSSSCEDWTFGEGGLVVVLIWSVTFSRAFNVVFLM